MVIQNWFLSTYTVILLKVLHHQESIYYRLSNLKPNYCYELRVSYPATVSELQFLLLAVQVPIFTVVNLPMQDHYKISETTKTNPYFLGMTCKIFHLVLYA